MAREGSEPVRTCVGCRRRAPAPELLRFVAEGASLTAAPQRTGGRGVWLCPNAACAAEAAHRRAFQRGLRNPDIRVTEADALGALGRAVEERLRAMLSAARRAGQLDAALAGTGLPTKVTDGLAAAMSGREGAPALQDVAGFPEVSEIIVDSPQTGVTSGDWSARILARFRELAGFLRSVERLPERRRGRRVRSGSGRR